MAPYPSFYPEGQKLGRSASPPFPTEPACAGLRRGPRWGINPSGAPRHLPFASSQAPYPSFPPKGEKLGHYAAPPFPTEPNSAAVSSFAALRMRHTPCGYRRLGFGGDPDGGLTPPALRATSPFRGGFGRTFISLPCKGRCPAGAEGSAAGMRCESKGNPPA